MLCEHCEETQSNYQFVKKRCESYRKETIALRRKEGATKELKTLRMEIKQKQAQVYNLEGETERLKQELSTVRMMLKNTLAQTAFKDQELEKTKRIVNNFEHVLNQLVSISPEVQAEMMRINQNLERENAGKGYAVSLQEEMSRMNLALLQARAARKFAKGQEK